MPALEEICSHVVDCKNRTAPIDPNGEYFAVGTPAMRGNVINYDEARRINATTFAEWTARLLPEEGDILFAREAPVGPLVVIPAGGKVAAGQRTMLLRADPEKANSDFLRLYLSAPVTQARILALAHGSTTPHLRVADVRSFPVNLPPLAEQHSIAEVLRALDDKIAANTKLAEVSEDLAVTLLSRLQSTVALSAVVRHHKKSKNPGQIETPQVAHYSLPAFDAVRRPELTPPTAIKSSKFSIEQPSVLISKLNPRFPRVWDVAEVPSIPALASTEFLVLEPLYSSTTFLWALLSQPGFGLALESKVAGTSGSHQRVKPADLLDTPVLDPRHVPESLRDQVTSLGRRGSQTRTESSFLTTTRDALLPQLMSGKLGVKDAEKVLENAGV